jgi:IrrE N-terminal-like domain
MSIAVQVVVARLLEGIDCPPTDLEALAKKVGISQCIEGDIAGSGELRKSGPTYTIVYSQFLPKSRQRFTIAHEIGHAFINKAWGGSFRPGKEVERLCDMMAAEILMPQPAVLEFTRNGVSIGTISKIARTFEASFASAAIRCAELEGLSVFEVERNRVLWSWGIVRKGPVDHLNESIKDAVKIAQEGKPTDEDFFFDGVGGLRPWRMDYIRRHQDRVFFLLQPVRQGKRGGALLQTS